MREMAENDDLLTRFTNALDCCGTCAGGVLARYTREAKAQAWDEGFTRGFYDVLAGQFQRDASESTAVNPYERAIPPGPTPPAEGDA